MPYMNSRLFARMALGLSLLAVPGLQAQDAPGGIRGDVDGDGRVTRADADAVRAYLVRGTLPGGRSILPAGDANGDGRVTAADAALISRFAAGVDVSRFPVGRPVSEGGGRTVSSQGTMMFTEYECGVDPRTRALVCEMVGAGVEGGARRDVLLLGTGAKFNGSPTATYVTGDTQDTMKVTVSIRNLLPQPIGTTDGVTADTVRVVFTAFRTTTRSSLPYSVANVVTRNGTATFTDSVNGGSPVLFPDRQYMDFPELIAPNDTSDAREIRIAYQKGLPGDFKFQYRIWSRVQYNRGNVVISPADSVIGAGQSLSLSGASFSVVGAPMAAETYNWNSSNPGVASVSPAGVVTGISGGTTTITATSSSESQRGGTRVIHVIQANSDNVAVTGNVRVTSPDSVILNDVRPVPVTLTFIPWGGTSDETWKDGEVDQLTPGGKFTYNPPAGLDGVDSVAYTITSGAFAVDTGKVALNINGMIWFVGGGETPCNPAAPNAADVCGRRTDPFPTLASFQAINNGSLSNPKAGDAIFLYEGTHAGSVTLLAQQRLIGQNATGDLATLAGISLAAGSDALPPLTPGGATARINGTVTLGADNHLRGVNIFAGSGAALVGTSFGTPVIAEVDSLSATGGPVLDLNTGTVSSTFASVTSTGSINFGLRLRSINGSLTVNAGSVTDADSATFQVSGGNVGVTWPGTLDQPNNAALVDVASHTGTLVFSGALSANNGSGLQFNAAQGTYTFSGTAALSGTNAGIDITNGSAGTFNFNAGTQITNTAGTGLYVYGSAPALVSYAGGITKGGTSAGRLVELGELTGGTVTFTPASTLTANSTNAGSTGISLSNVAAAVNFDGTANLTGGDAGIDILSASSGTFVFSANTLVQNPSGTAFNVNGSSPNITYNGSLIRTANNALLVDITSMAAGKTITFNPAAGTDSLYATIGDGILLSNVDGAVDFNARVRLAGGNAGVDIVNGSTGNIDFDAATIVNPTGEALRIFNGSGGDQAADVSFAGAISTNAGRPVLVEDVSGGTVAVSASINATGQGLLVQNNSGGTFTFSNATQALNTAGNAAVTLANNTGATVNFTGGTLDIDVTSGAGFAATGGGTVNVTGSGNTVNATAGGTAVNVTNTTIGGSGVTFLSVAANGGTNGIVLNNTGTSGGLTVTGAGSVAGSGGSIVNTTGADGSTQGAGIYLNNTRNVSLAFMALSGHANWAIRGNSVVGFTMNKTRITGTNGTTTATDDGSIYFTELTGSASITGSFIDGGFEDGVLVDNTTGTLNRITFDGDTIGSSSEISGDGMRLEASGGTLNATIQNTRFARAAGDMFQHNIIGTAQSDLVFLNNTLINGHPAISGGGGGVTITAAESGDLTYDINGNTIRGAKGVALVVNKPFGGAPGNGTMSGFIRNNVIGTAGGTQNGSSEGSGMLIGLLAQGTHTTRIEDNQIYDYEEMGIFFNIGGTSQSVTGLTHNGTVNATVVGNVIAEPLNLPGALAQNGIHLNAGTNSDGGNDAYQICMDIGSGVAADRNTINGSGAAGGTDFRLRQRFATTVRLPGYTGSNTDNAAVTTFVQNRNNNSGSTTGGATNTVATGGGGFVNTSPAGSACTQP
jgi:hypothetical protein